MKTIFKTMMMTAVAVAAFGAERHLKFQVEFPFTVSGKVMPAGQYRISERSTGAHGLFLENIQAKTGAFVALSSRDTVKYSDPARIEFACANSGCKIASITNLSGGLRYSSRKLPAAGSKMVAVLMTPSGE